jgi:hypothetical protein
VNDPQDQPDLRRRLLNGESRAAAAASDCVIADYLSASGPRRGQLYRAQNIPIWSSRSG